MRRNRTEENQSKAKCTNHTSQRLDDETVPQTTNQKEGKVTITEEVEAHQNAKNKERPDEEIHSVCLHILFKIASSSASPIWGYIF